MKFVCLLVTRGLPVLLALLVLSACGNDHTEEMDQREGESNMGAMQGAPPADEIPAQARIEDGVQVVEITAGPDGYRPGEIVLQADMPARLIFTRTTDSECLQQVQIPEFGIGKTDLPMNEPVAIEFTPGESGEFTFVCGMDMQRGALVVKS